MPFARATTACPSSWISSDAKKSTAAIAPMSRYTVSLMPGSAPGKTLDENDQRMSANRKNQEKSILISNPNVVPSRKLATALLSVGDGSRRGREKRGTARARSLGLIACVSRDPSVAALHEPDPAVVRDRDRDLGHAGARDVERPRH